MTAVEVILARCRELGVTLTPTEAGVLRVRAPMRPPLDLLEALRQFKGEILVLLEPSHEPLASPATTDAECLASLDTEEALFRVWWWTLPDKNLARQRWRSTLSWYCQEKSLEPEMRETLQQRVQDLWETS